MRKLLMTLWALGALSLAGYAYAACVKPQGDCVKSVGRSAFASRPTASKATVGQLWVVTDCSSTLCTAGGGTNECLTYGNSAGTGWVNGVCGVVATTTTTTTTVTTTT